MRVRFIVDSSSARTPGGQVGGAVRDVVDLDVVRVAVVAVPVVPDQDVGVLLVEDGASCFATTSTSAPCRAPSAPFCSHPVMPESA